MKLPVSRIEISPINISPIIAAFIIAGSTGLVLPALAQLPPTNMGKFVHQPGDNQYSPETQATRHGEPVQPQMQGGGGQRMRTQASSLPAVDISIEPIACDEPIPIAGFPPLPDRLDLPVSTSGGSWLSGAGGGASGGGNSGGGMSLHQHYGHVTIPDINRSNGNGYGQAPVNGGGGGTGGGGSVRYYKVKSMPIDIPNHGVPSPSNSSGGVGYYKAGTAHIDLPDHSVPHSANAPGRDGYSNAGTMDVYNTNSSQPGYKGASDKDIKALGREPQLNADGSQTSEAPQAVTVNQATTQDLSLPEDDFSYRYKPTSGAEKFGKSAAKGLGTMIKKLPINSMGGMGGF